MSSTTLLDLPAELLDRIYWYLDWDRTASLTPEREDILSISLTCKHLHASIVALVFRNVKLDLRWLDGELVEPSLFRLRRQRPDLAQHIRCVHIVTHLGYHYGEGRTETPFRVPEDTREWLNPELKASSTSEHYRTLHAVHRERVDLTIRSLFSDEDQQDVLVEKRQAESVLHDMMSAMGDDESLVYSSHAHLPHLSEGAGSSTVQPQRSNLLSTAAAESTLFDNAATLATRQHADRDLKLRADALAVVMLCLPAALTSLVFEAWPVPGNAHNTFALHILAAALKVFATRLESLTTITTPQARLRVRSMVNVSSSVVSPALVAEISGLRSLSLSPLDASGGARYPACLANYMSWHAVSATLTHLEIWNLRTSHADKATMLKFVEGFSSLQVLALRHFTLLTSGRQRIVGNQDSPELLWLEWAIAIRRLMPHASIIFTDTRVGDPPRNLPASALHWTMHEAIPQHSDIGFDREQRLMDDFPGFLPLWEAEDSDRGLQAAGERKDGGLVDAAMCSRWKQYSNVRRDQGEWTTM